MRRQRGITLLELMIALGLAGLLLSMAVPALGTFVSNARQTGAINDFVSSIHLARSTAVTTNARVTICPSSNGTSCEAVDWSNGWIVFSDQDSDQTVDGTERIIGTSGEVNDLTIESAEFDTYLTFRPNGRVGNGTFTLCDPDRNEHRITVFLSGRTRIDKRPMGNSRCPAS